MNENTNAANRAEGVNPCNCGANLNDGFHLLGCPANRADGIPAPLHAMVHGYCCTENERLTAERDRLARRVKELEAEVDLLRDRVSPRYSIPIEEALGPLKPCPFCGSESIGTSEHGVYCNNCDATNSTLSWQFRPPDLRARCDRLVEALVHYKDHCLECFGSSRVLINDDDPEAGGMPCPTCKVARAALEEKP